LTGLLRSGSPIDFRLDPVPYPDELLDLGGENDLGIDSIVFVTTLRRSVVVVDVVTFS
jgi:hypothetical protein